MYSPLIDILFGDFIISKKIHLWNFYFYRTHVNVEIANAKNSILFPSFLSKFYLIKEKAQKLSITFLSSFLTSGHNVQKFYFSFNTPLLDIMSKGFAFSFWLSTFRHYVQRFYFLFLALHFQTLCPKVLLSSFRYFTFGHYVQKFAFSF